ncbi:MAG TPA: CADD family putative folate metabolism protein [Thermoanaerobaculia bacterium]|nr:CADD family putative folate metabolism protein [Thermoanaerobaculia bacterium]
MDDVMQQLDGEIAGRRLLDHPFYQRWSSGELTKEELREYARQYYHYAAAFPTFLSGMHAHTEDIPTRQLLLENLIEEEHGPENHPELWLRFCEALGLDREEVLAGEANQATRALIDCMRSAARDGQLHEGLAALYSYESQVPGVAAAKIDGLAKWYGITGDRSIAFFSVHLAADVAHSETSRGLLRRLCDSDEKRDAARKASASTLAALYGFLDSVTMN